MKTLVTVPIKADDPEKVDQLLRSKQPDVSAFEIWLDAMPRSLQTFPLVEKTCRHWRTLTKKKLIFVCKDPKEQGNFMATDDVRVEVLLRAAKAGADYVDVGVHAKKEEIKRLKTGLKKTKLILSFHDFSKTPSDEQLKTIVKNIRALKPDVVKIATLVKSLEDNQRLIELAMDLKKRRLRHIVIGMGEKGIITRILSQALGNELQFVAHESSTAPGQLSLAQALEFKTLFASP